MKLYKTVLSFILQPKAEVFVIFYFDDIFPHTTFFVVCGNKSTVYLSIYLHFYVNLLKIHLSFLF